MSERTLLLWNEAKMNVFRYAVSCFLEFTWTAVVAINGKFTRTYTAFRPELETFVKTSCELAVTGVTSASSHTSPSATSHMQLGANFSDLLDAGWAFGGNLKDESDEMKTLERIKTSIGESFGADGLHQGCAAASPLLPRGVGVCQADPGH